MCAKKKYITSNPDLPIIKTGWTQNPMDNAGLYRNLYERSERDFKDLFKWQFGEKPHKAEKKTESFAHNVISNNPFLSNKNEGIIWLGHASFLIHCNGLRILTDPIFWAIPGLKRLTAMPCLPTELVDIDIILLSHNHRDHADERSMKLVCQQNPKATILTGLQIGNLLRGWGIQNPIQEAGWYQQYHTPGIRISYLPAKHWNRRFLWDLNTMLWGSFMIEGNKNTIFFGADSGYDAHFVELPNLFEKIDISILGCGAYKPEWFMSTSHKSPIEAVQAFHDTKAHTFIPMHIGTFDLSDEPLSEPFRLLKKYEAESAVQGKLRVLDIGETMVL